MKWKNYRESIGSPASCEIIITHDARDEGHPFIRDRVVMYQVIGKRVTLKIAKQPGDKKHDPKKDKLERAGHKAVAPIIKAQTRTS